jgi:hypothetical protein
VRLCQYLDALHVDHRMFQPLRRLSAPQRIAARSKATSKMTMRAISIPPR